MITRTNFISILMCLSIAQPAFADSFRSKLDNCNDQYKSSDYREAHYSCLEAFSYSTSRREQLSALGTLAVVYRAAGYNSVATDVARGIIYIDPSNKWARNFINEDSSSDSSSNDIDIVLHFDKSQSRSNQMPFSIYTVYDVYDVYDLDKNGNRTPTGKTRRVSRAQWDKVPNLNALLNGSSAQTEREPPSASSNRSTSSSSKQGDGSGAVLGLLLGGLMLYGAAQGVKSLLNNPSSDDGTSSTGWMCTSKCSGVALWSPGIATYAIAGGDSSSARRLAEEPLREQCSRMPFYMSGSGSAGLGAIFCERK